VRTLIEEGLRGSAAEYLQCRQHQASLKERFSSGWDGVDALVCPATPGPAPDRSTTGDPVFNSVWSYLGVPVVSFPIGLAANGLPLAAQLAGRSGGDVELLRVAAWCEQVWAGVRMQPTGAGRRC
jgi:aspartyl-tRNA(Asn)/glutamyl-tRNA(Gln) amidotransferase subunit A